MQGTVLIKLKMNKINCGKCVLNPRVKDIYLL